MDCEAQFVYLFPLTELKYNGLLLYQDMNLFKMHMHA